MATQAQEDLGRALAVRGELGRGKEGLAEAVMAMGYLFYCRAGCTVRAGRCRPDGSDVEVRAHSAWR